MRKIIGVPGWAVGPNSFGVTNTYLQFINRYGTPRILLPEEDIVDVDLLVLTGGADLYPLAYGAAPEFCTQNPDVYKQFFYDKRLPTYIEQNIPIFGICLGHQMLLAKFGCILQQDLPFHEQSKDRWDPAHKIFGTPKSKQFGKDIRVNSHHHQGVLHSGLSDEIDGLFYAENEEDKSDGIVEAACHKTRPIYSVQYHPEELYDEISHRIITKLLNNE